MLCLFYYDKKNYLEEIPLEFTAKERKHGSVDSLLSFVLERVRVYTPHFPLCLHFQEAPNGGGYLCVWRRPGNGQGLVTEGCFTGYMILTYGCISYF